MLFSWPVIKLILNILNILFGNGIKVCLLWDILSNQAVCIFVCPTFPAVVRRCEIEIDVQCFGNLFMIGKLLSVIGGDGFNKAQSAKASRVAFFTS